MVTLEGTVSGRGQDRAFWLRVVFCFLIWVLVTQAHAVCEHLSGYTHDACTFLYVSNASIENLKENQLLCLIDDIRALVFS